MNNKLNEYKKKVIVLKEKIKELYGIIDKLKNKNYQTLSNNNYKNYMDIQPIISSPNQVQKSSFVNTTGHNYFNISPLINSKKSNVMMMKNLSRPYGNSVGNYYRNKNGI